MDRELVRTWQSYLRNTFSSQTIVLLVQQMLGTTDSELCKSFASHVCMQHISTFWWYLCERSQCICVYIYYHWHKYSLHFHTQDTFERQDFNGSLEIRVSFTPSSGSDVRQVLIPYIDDDINEKDEGFLVVLVIDDTQTDPANVELIDGGVALMIIANDDGMWPYMYVYIVYATVRVLVFLTPTAITLGFQDRQLTVREDAGIQNNPILVIKANDMVSEQILSFNIDLIIGSATEGQFWYFGFSQEYVREP